MSEAKYTSILYFVKLFTEFTTLLVSKQDKNDKKKGSQDGWTDRQAEARG
jgi:hypothetical protein